MEAKPKQLREAKSRKGMRIISVALPEAMHRALLLARVHDRVSVNEAIREAIKLWLSHRRRAGR